MFANTLKAKALYAIFKTILRNTGHFKKIYNKVVIFLMQPSKFFDNCGLSKKC